MKNRLRIQSEFLWIAFIIIATIAVLVPIYKYVAPSILLDVSLFMIVSLLFFRFIIFLKQVFFLQPFAAKLGLVALNIPFFFFILKRYNKLTNLMELYTYEGTSLLKAGMNYSTYNYLNNLILLSGMGALLLTIILQFRLIFTVFKHKQVPGVQVHDTLN